MNQFDPLTVLERLLRGWWLMVLLAVLGAVLGRAAAVLLPPVYSAQAEYYVSVDHILFAEERGLEHVLALDLKDTLNAVLNITTSEEVVEATVNAAAEAGISITADEFRQNVRLDRYYTSWLFTVHAGDPQTAATLADLWVQATDAALQEALRNAIEAHHLSLEIGLLGRCFAENALADANTCAGTSFASVEAFNTALADLEARREEAWTASRQMDHTMQLEIVRPANVPSEPIRNAPNLLLVGGAALGWLIGLSVAMGGFPPKRKPA